MEEVTITRNNDEVVAHIFIENGNVTSITQNGFKVNVDGAELKKDTESIEGGAISTSSIKVMVDGKTICESLKEQKEKLPISIRVENKLIDLLESVDKKTATPEMLEASARIAELLLKY